MWVKILGCGSSNGTPQIGCKCYVCKSKSAKNKRFRPSIFINLNGVKVLVDATPDLRSQVLLHNINEIDALIITHDHADHVAGLDDMRYFAFQRSSKTIPIYITPDTYRSVKSKFTYLFEKRSKIYNPIFEVNIIDYYNDIVLGSGANSFQIQTMRQIHGEVRSLGLRIGNFAYSTDFKYLEPKGYKVLEGIDNWIIDCQKYHWSPSHLNYELSLKNIERVSPKQAYLTHLAHDFCFHELTKILPKGVAPAFDGLTIEVKV